MNQRGQVFFFLFFVLLLLLCGCQSVWSFEREDYEQSNRQRKLSLMDRIKNTWKSHRERRLVNSIIKNVEQARYYEALGLHESPKWERRFKFALFENTPKEFVFFDFTLFRASGTEIKRAYRQRALGVHPDKNGHPLAAQAFDALENAKQALMDEREREEYDRVVKEHYRRVDEARMETATRLVGFAYQKTMDAFVVVKKVAGPFAMPLIIVGAIII
mmetsp:Transcript_1133/g.1648  ORF Transcript_1133/g.1648 Transcript_1133/m.1648 type:complete len:217 (-) Transcript_1133:316-966(-)